MKLSAVNPSFLNFFFKSSRFSGVDETDSVFSDGKGGAGNGINPYGLNRYYLEAWARKQYPNALIVRLPGLYGYNIKKNFIYDYMNVIPTMLNSSAAETGSVAIFRSGISSLSAVWISSQSRPKE